MQKDEAKAKAEQDAEESESKVRSGLSRRTKLEALVLALIGLTGWPWLVALIVARAADIFKVLPGVKRAELLPGAVGVTMDDVVAGAYGLAAGWLVVWLF